MLCVTSCYITILHWPVVENANTWILFVLKSDTWELTPLEKVFTVIFIQLHISANISTPPFIVSISDFKRKEYIQQQIIGSRVSSGFVGTSKYTIIGFNILTRSGQHWNQKREVGVINQKLLIYSMRVFFHHEYVYILYTILKKYIMCTGYPFNPVLAQS